MPIIFPRFPKVVLTGDADPGNVMIGKTFYKDDYKQKLTGTYVPEEPPVLDGNATPGDVLAGKTFYKDDAYTKLTGTVPSKAAATITPGTTNQVIAAGQYLAGAQTIAGSANLLAGNIKQGENIFGVVGTYEGEPVTPGNFDIAGFPNMNVSLTETYEKKRSAVINRSGTYQVKFTLRAGIVGNFARIYKNGIPYGIERQIYGGAEETYTETLTFAKNDTIEFWMKTEMGTASSSNYLSDINIGISALLTITQ